MSYSWLEANENRFLYADFRKLRGKEYLSLALDLNNEISTLEDSSVRILLDMRIPDITPEEFSYIKQVSKIVQPKIKKSCIVISKRITDLILKTYVDATGSRAYFTTSLKEGMEYVSE